MASKLVLLALADNANDQGECFPSVTHLAHKCCIDERTVQRHITELEEAGIVSRKYRTGHSTLYLIDASKLSTTPGTLPPRHAATPGRKSPPPPAQRHPTPGTAPPITVSEPSVEPSSSVAAKKLPLGFEQFWGIYPRKTAKANAIKAWTKAHINGELNAVLAAVEAQKGTDQWQRGIIPHAATWLNQRRWEDGDILGGSSPWAGAI